MSELNPYPELTRATIGFLESSDQPIKRYAAGLIRIGMECAKALQEIREAGVCRNDCPKCDPHCEYAQTHMNDAIKAADGAGLLEVR